MPDAVNATECGLDICLQRYKGSMQSSKFNEEVLDTFIDTTSFLKDATVDGLPTDFAIDAPSSWNEPGKRFLLPYYSWAALQNIFHSQTTPIFQGRYSNMHKGDTDIANLLQPMTPPEIEKLMARYVDISIFYCSSRP